MRYASLLLLFVSIAAFAADHRPVCPGPAGPDTGRCHARVISDAHGQPQVGGAPPLGALGPADFKDAYKLASTGSSSITIAIVDAYDDPNIASDLNVYSAQYNLPACNTSNPCFQKVDQRGGTRYPKTNASWSLEIALDVEMAHAICPACKILLVEADSNSFSNLNTAENYAAAHATVVSNSWGGGESSGETGQDTYYNHPGVPITFSSGDSGYGVEYPAASPFVTAVGGTHLTRDGSVRGWSESAWSGAGSGCSAYEAKPSWQTDTGCAKRTVADVSADADPNTGAAVYDSVRYWGQAGWFQVGGTSLASPIVAGMYALAGGNTTAAKDLYSHTSSLFDISGGSNGNCGGSYLCTAVTGYDGPTGLGTPDGVSAF